MRCANFALLVPKCTHSGVHYTVPSITSLKDMQKHPRQTMMLTLRQLRFVLLLVALHLRGVNGMDSPPPPVPVVERHLVCQGCKETKISELFSSLKDELVQRINFTSVWCIASEEDELEAIEHVLQRQQELPHAEIHVVATLLQANWCQALVAER